LFDSCTLPLTSARRIDMLVSEMAVTVFPEGKATPLERVPTC
jgi:acetate CoA/acetoacetate CoA-transferase beta subunit